jgi:hypothetical protein
MLVEEKRLPDLSHPFNRALSRMKDEAQGSGSVFEFEPVPLDVFVMDKGYLSLPPLSARQAEAVTYSTQIYKEEEIRALKWKKHRFVDECVFLWGKGSGKDFVARIILLRIAYLLLALRNPQAYFYHPDMPCGIERIDMLNTATTKEQAANVFFGPLRKYISTSPFFRNRAEVYRSEIKFDKAIHLISGHSEAEAQEGLNLIAVVLDEIAAFKTDEEVSDIKRLKLRKNVPQSAASLYDFAKTTVLTRFPQAGKVILLSFPRFTGDFITTKYEEGKDKYNVYVSKGATFEINPIRKRSDFEREKEESPERYKARILCEPGVAEDAFFKNMAAVKRSFKLELPSPVDPDTGRFRSWFVCKDNFYRFGHVDLAKNRDRAAVAFCHAFQVEKREMEITEEVEGQTKAKVIVVDLPHVRLDCLVYFKAPPGGEVDFEAVRNCILDFVDCRGFKVELITFDGYQSVQMKQSLEAKGLTVDDQSVDRTREAYETWQDAVYEGRFVSYYIKDLVEDEIPFLIDFKGRKIEHRKERGKDGSDAVAGAVNNCVKSEMWGSAEFWAA